jgi:phosphoribosylaminoimidazolecarboxamide formyltransferase / IMP cyclohydrolase
VAFNSVQRAEDLVPLRHILVSAYDKAGLEEFIRGIVEASSTAEASSSSGIASAKTHPAVVFYSTGGSYEALAKILSTLPRGSSSLMKISDYTGQPEMKGGLVKTLDWKIYLGLLAEAGDASHEADLERSGAVAFDMVICNLYPFAEASADPSSSPEELRQRIDIGGPSMLRASAKNFLRVASVSSPAQYGALLDELRETGGRTRLETRRRLAAETFALVSGFDALVSKRLGELDSELVASAYGLE